MPTCMFTRTAAGTAVAMAIQWNLQPYEFDGTLVSEKVFQKEKKP